MSQLKGKPGIRKLRPKMRKQAEKTILVVDDVKAIQDLLSNILKNYNVLVASTGKEALDIVKKKKPDLVLLDINMPGINGIETLRQIKEIDNNIAVIMLSAYETRQANLEAARLGVYTSMAKPFDLDEIKTTIKSALASITKSDKTQSTTKTRKRK